MDLVRLGQQCAEMESSSSSLTSQSTTDSSSDLPGAQRRSGYCPEDTEDSVDDREAIGDLLEEAMDSESEEPSTSSASPVMMVNLLGMRACAHACMCVCVSKLFLECMCFHKKQQRRLSFAFA